jgi:hypothetical protein
VNTIRIVYLHRLERRRIAIVSVLPGVADLAATDTATGSRRQPVRHHPDCPIPDLDLSGLRFRWIRVRRGCDFPI